MGIEQANNQQLAVAANLAQAQSLDTLLQNTLDKKVDQNQEQSNVLSESALQKALEKGGGKAGEHILAQIAARLAQQMPANKIMQSLKEDFGFALENKEEGGRDRVEIKSADYYVGKNQKAKQDPGQQGGSDGQQADQRPASRAAVKEYLGAYSQFLVSGGGEAKKKLEQLETSLLKDKGFSPKELQSVKLNAANSVRSEIMRQVKQSYIKQLCAPGKSVEELLSKKEVQGYIDFAFFNDKLGGYDFGGREGDLKGAVDRQTGDQSQELKDFVAEKLTEGLTSKTVGEQPENKIVKEIDQVLKLGEKIGFDIQGFMQRLPDISLDQGLLPVIAHNQGAQAAAGGQGGSADERPRQYQYTADEEKDILTDKLRALYLRRAVNGDSRTILETQFKMIKLKNGLIKLGVSNTEQIETEGKGLARYRLMEMLREGFEERATYAKLSGSAWSITEKKIKTVLRNLEKLGVALSQTELDSLRDKANAKMLQEAQEELAVVKAAIEARGPVAFLTGKQKLLTDVIARLCAESNLGNPGQELRLVREAV
ncbi:MAG: hypothetical protein MUC35_05935 [Candidatus Margulisbacteria bacterium]|jgi:hypothetical protein|nr:hypothetical protein [Candidatus Margulisiibacteriota bacterium]